MVTGNFPKRPPYFDEQKFNTKQNNFKNTLNSLFSSTVCSKHLSKHIFELCLHSYIMLLQRYMECVGIFSTF